MANPESLDKIEDGATYRQTQIHGEGADGLPEPIGATSEGIHSASDGKAAYRTANRHAVGSQKAAVTLEYGFIGIYNPTDSVMDLVIESAIGKDGSSNGFDTAGSNVDLIFAGSNPDDWTDGTWINLTAVSVLETNKRVGDTTSVVEFWIGNDTTPMTNGAGARTLAKPFRQLTTLNNDSNSSEYVNGSAYIIQPGSFIGFRGEKINQQVFGAFEWKEVTAAT